MNILPKSYTKMNLKTKQILFISIVSILCILSFVLAIFIGSTNLGFKETFKAIFNQSDNTSNIIVRQIRLPRALGGLFAGIGLGVAGSILQSLLQNDLASPNTIGVNAGAGLFVMIGITFFNITYKFISIFAFLGAFITTMIIYLIAKKGGNKRVTIILSGIAITSLFNAIIKMLFIFYPDQAVSSNTFLIGTLDNVSLEDVLPSVIIILVSVVVSIMFARVLNILTLGDNISKALGVNVNVYRFIFILLASLLAGSVVAYAGLLGFIGLIIPHLCKKFVGNDARVLMISSGIAGGFLVTICDTLSRFVFSPYEIPVGIITAIIGAPFFLYLILKRSRKC